MHFQFLSCFITVTVDINFHDSHSSNGTLKGYLLNLEIFLIDERCLFWAQPVNIPIILRLIVMFPSLWFGSLRWSVRVATILWNTYLTMLLLNNRGIASMLTFLRYHRPQSAVLERFKYNIPSKKHASRSLQHSLNKLSRALSQWH